MLSYTITNEIQKVIGVANKSVTFDCKNFTGKINWFLLKSLKEGAILKV